MRTLSARSLVQVLDARLSRLGWERSVRKPRATGGYGRFYEVDYLRDGVGVEIATGNRASAETAVFVKFPYLVRVGQFKRALLLLPTRSFARRLPDRIATYEETRELLREMQPLTLQYQLAVAGLSPEPSEFEAVELTSELDVFLNETAGLTLGQMAAFNEGASYDFKLAMPDARKFAQSVCAFANLGGGGVFIFGVDEDGGAVGVAPGKALDELQLKLVNVLRDSCAPAPRFEFRVFENPQRRGTAILVMRVLELERKPCMTRNRVYVRSGASVRAAGPEDVRRLVLG